VAVPYPPRSTLPSNPTGWDDAFIFRRRGTLKLFRDTEGDAVTPAIASLGKRFGAEVIRLADGEEQKKIAEKKSGLFMARGDYQPRAYFRTMQFYFSGLTVASHLCVRTSFLFSLEQKHFMLAAIRDWMVAFCTFEVHREI